MRGVREYRQYNRYIWKRVVCNGKIFDLVERTDGICGNDRSDPFCPTTPTYQTSADRVQQRQNWKEVQSRVDRKFALPRQELSRHYRPYKQHYHDPESVEDEDHGVSETK